MSLIASNSQTPQHLLTQSWGDVMKIRGVKGRYLVPFKNNQRAQGRWGAWARVSCLLRRRKTLTSNPHLYIQRRLVVGSSDTSTTCSWFTIFTATEWEESGPVFNPAAEGPLTAVYVKSANQNTIGFGARWLRRGKQFLFWVHYQRAVVDTSYKKRWDWPVCFSILQLMVGGHPSPISEVHPPQA